MQPLPAGLVDETQLMQKHYAFELIDEAKHRPFLESMMSEEDVLRALAGWNNQNIEHPDFYSASRIIKRLSDGAYVCYMDTMIIKSTETSFKVINGARMMHPSVRDRGVSTKAMVDEGLYYWFMLFPWKIDVVEANFSPGVTVATRTSVVADSTESYTSNPDSHRLVSFSRQSYMDFIYG